MLMNLTSPETGLNRLHFLVDFTFLCPLCWAWWLVSCESLQKLRKMPKNALCGFKHIQGHQVGANQKDLRYFLING